MTLRNTLKSTTGVITELASPAGETFSSSFFAKLAAERNWTFLGLPPPPSKIPRTYLQRRWVLATKSCSLLSEPYIWQSKSMRLATQRVLPVPERPSRRTVPPFLTIASSSLVSLTVGVKLAFTLKLSRSHSLTSWSLRGTLDEGSTSISGSMSSKSESVWTSSSPAVGRGLVGRLELLKVGDVGLLPELLKAGLVGRLEDSAFGSGPTSRSLSRTRS
mmetsp:Transcript_31855/g.93590  ORF Transcript_31855/g.93590 Transcript_31855/m.93590 type:complete len:218 (-) Transcript_31855:1914-2567(-)